MQGHAQKCVERFCALANKTTDKLHKVYMETVGELSEVCSHIVSRCLYLLASGPFDKTCDEVKQSMW